MRSRVTALFVLFAPLSACEPDQPRDPCGLALHGRVDVTADDARGRGIETSDAWLEKDGYHYACDATGWRERRCRIWKDGVYTVVAIVDGEELRGEVVVERDEFCNLLSDPVVLVDPRFICVPEEVDVIHGQLFWSEGEPIGEEDGVEVWIGDGADGMPCDVEGHSYSCGALAADARSYRVHASFDNSFLSQDVPVQLDDCVVAAPAEFDFVRASWPCDGHVEEGMEVTVGITGGDIWGQATLDIVPAGSVHVVDASGVRRECELRGKTPEYPLWRPFSCPVKTPAGGLYTIEVEYEGRSERVLTFLSDDGCAPIHSHLDLKLSPDQICDFAQCAPAGTLLRSQALCGSVSRGTLDAPPCN